MISVFSSLRFGSVVGFHVALGVGALDGDAVVGVTDGYRDGGVEGVDGLKLGTFVGGALIITDDLDNLSLNAGVMTGTMNTTRTTSGSGDAKLSIVAIWVPVWLLIKISRDHITCFVLNNRTMIRRRAF